MTNLTFSNGYALLIGVGADLTVTVKDAAALYDVLVNPARAGYPLRQVWLLTEADARRDHILNSFDELIEQVNSNPNATVIIYFSGHGIRVEHQGKLAEYFLVPYGYDSKATCCYRYLRK